uniref:Zinc finger protein n=1 Tax=Parastrongyloides trichosuri TaxID=131310 RepID=A0A0N4ZC87_PARTI
MDEKIIVNTVLHFVQKYKTMEDIENIIYEGFSPSVLSEAIEQLNSILRENGYESESSSLLELYNKLDNYCRENDLVMPKFVIDDIESVPKNLCAKLTCESKLDLITDEIRCLRKTMEEIRERAQQGDKRVSPRRKKRRLSAELRSQKNGVSIADDCSSSSGDLHPSAHNTFCSSSSSSTSLIGSASSPSNCLLNDLSHGSQNLSVYLSNHSTPSTNNNSKESSRRTGGKLANCVQRLTDRLGSQKESVSPNEIETSDSPSSEIDNGIQSSPTTPGILFENFLNQGIPLYTALNPNLFAKKVHQPITPPFSIDPIISAPQTPNMDYLSLLISNATRNFSTQNKQFPISTIPTVGDGLISTSQKIENNDKEGITPKMEIDGNETDHLWSDISPALSNGPKIEFGGNQDDTKSECDKPFVCEQENCNKRFANKFLLKKHQFIHTGLRPHACPYCQKRFNRKDNLLRHKKTHTQTGMPLENQNVTVF